MSIRDVDKPATGKANCKVCWEPIDPKAVKCPKCGSYQDWTRHLVRWTALLVSLLALVPLWNISRSLTQLAFAEKKAARIEAALTSCGESELRVVFENSGELSGIVTGAHFGLLLDGVRSSPDVQIKRDDGSGDILISPKADPVPAVYKAYIGKTEAKFVSKASRAASCAYQLHFDWIDFAGSKKQLRRECPCP